jgi:hypothetical protein
MPLVKLELPSPRSLRAGWAALSVVCAARGWADSAYAKPDRWLYNDGGGNWACLLFQEDGKAVLVGHDHEYSETYFRESAKYFGEEETDLLAGAPAWWGRDLNPVPYGEWIGFVYGWDGAVWQRANYELPDGFRSVGLLKACSFGGMELLSTFASDAPGLGGNSPDPAALETLVAADGKVTPVMLEAVVPGWDIAAGVGAAKKFLEVSLEVD